jgi:hypothetical protein
MIVLEDEERSGHWMPGTHGTHDHEPQMMTGDDLTNMPPGWVAWGGERTLASEDWLPAEEEWSYDLFDLQDCGLVPSY